MDKEQQLQSDMNLLNEYAPEAEKTEETQKEWLSYYLDIISAEWIKSPAEDKMDFIKNLLSM